MTTSNFLRALIFMSVFHISVFSNASETRDETDKERIHHDKDKRHDEPLFSLFFTPQELEEIMGDSELSVSQAASPLPVLCLQALFYTSSTSWCLWINGQLVTPSLPYRHLKILKISSESVLFAEHFFERPKQFSLLPHQCYDPNQQKITELAS